MDDDRLLALVARSLTDGRPPADAMEAAYAAFGWRTVDAELARLIEDAEPEVVAFHQGPRYSRVVALDTDHGAVEVAIGAHGFEVTVSPRPEYLVLRRPDGAAELALDAEGRASSAGVTGPVRLEITWASGSALTSWFTL